MIIILNVATLGLLLLCFCCYINDKDKIMILKNIFAFTPQNFNSFTYVGITVSNIMIFSILFCFSIIIYENFFK